MSTCLAEIPTKELCVPTVAVFRETFLRQSETFVRDHLLNLPTWSPEVVTTGLHPDRLPVPGVPVHVAAWDGLGGRLRWKAGQLAGRPPGRTIAPAVRREVDRIGPDVVHAHFGPDTAMAAYALRRTSYPLVGTFHGFDVMTRPEILSTYGWSAKQLVDGGAELLNRLSALVAVSSTLRDALVRKGAPPERVHVIPCGVRTDDFPWTPPPAEGSVLFVGRLVDKKGVADLIRAMGGVQDAPTTVVIGKGPLEAELRALAAELRVDVDFRGAQSTERVRAAMREAAVVAMPSQTAPNGDTEGMPVVSVEAGASGRPVVGYRHSGLVDSVLDGHTGLLYEERDVQGLRAGITRLLGDGDLRLRFSRAGRQHVAAHFELVDCLRQLESVYETARADHDVKDPVESR